MSYEPLTDEQVMEHALRTLVDSTGVSHAISKLRVFNRSVLDERAALLLERIEHEVAGITASEARSA